MTLYFDKKLGILTTISGSLSPLRSVQHKRGDESKIKVVFSEDGVAENLVGDFQIYYVLKQEPGDDVAALALADTWEAVAGETGAYMANFDTRGEELKELLEDLTRKSFYSELTFTDESGGPTSSQLLTAIVENDLYRGDESSPTVLPGPEDWLDARAVRFDKAQTLTDAQKQSARSNIDAMPEPIIRDTAPVEAVAAVSARAVMVLAGPSLGDTFTIDGVVFEFVASAGSDPSIVYIGLDELAPEESWPTIIMAINANVASVSATFRSDDSELDIVADTAGTSGNSIAVSTIGGVSFIDSSYEVAETLVGGAAAIPATAAQAVGQLVRVGAAPPYTWHRVQTLSPNTFAPTTPTIAEITGLTDALAAKQPLDSDLTAYANAADAAARRALLALAPDTTGNANLNAILAAGPAASRDALMLGTAAPTDVIDSLKWTRKSLVNSANTGVVNSVRVLVTGDSIGVDGWPKSAFNVFGKSTTAFRLSSTSPTRGGAATYETSQFAYWPSGNISKTTGASDTLIYPTATTGFFRGSFRICYITEPGAGTFKIEQRASGSTGAWTDNWVTLESDISADGILGSSIKTYALSGEQNQIRITGMSGVVRFIGVAVIPTGQHVLEICAAEVGTTPVQQNTTPTSILGPILTNLAPTVCFWRGYESQEDLTTALPAFTAKLLSVVPNMDMVLTGLHPMTVISDEENIARNAIVSAHARAIGGTFIDAFTPFKDTATMSSLGYLLDGLHLNNQGNVEVQYVQTASLPTLEANAKYPLSKYMLNEGIVGSSSPAFNMQGTGLTATRLGFSPQIGAGPGFYLPSNYSGYPAGSLFFQFNSINSKLKFDGNGFWAADFGTIPYAAGLNRASTGSIEGTAYSTSKPGLVAAGISGQTANIFEVRTGASIGTAGTIASGFNSAGAPFSSVIPIKADDAAADADAAIPSGGYYRVTGSRVLYVKP